MYILRMATRWPSARQELGLEIEWRIAFVKPGTVAVPGVDAIYLDVGGKLCPGIIDHHQGTPRASSAARLLFEHPELVMEHLVAPWQRALLALGAKKGAERTVRPTVVIHESPDFDALVTAHLAMSLVEHGQFPKHAKALVEYADRVDQGFERFDYRNPKPLLYPLILALSHIDADDAVALHNTHTSVHAGSADEARFFIGQKLIKRWAAFDRPGAGTTLEKDAGDPEVNYVLSGTKWVCELNRRLAEAVGAFERLKQERSVVCVGDIEVPVGAASTTKLLGSAIPRFHPLALNKFYLRNEGADGRPTPLTVIHGWMSDASTGLGRARFIISIDPTFKIADERPSLRGLAAALEWKEAEVRRGIEGAVEERCGAARFPEFPGNRDPWYDGRGHDYTIVDSPQCGTCLSFEQVLEVLRAPFWDPIVRESVVVHFARTGSPRSTVRMGTRVGEIVETLNTIRGGSGDGQPPFQLVVADLNPGWGPTAVADFARFVAGGAYDRLSNSLGECYVGARGVLVDSRCPREDAEALQAHFERIARLLTALTEIDAEIAEAGADELPSSRCRALLRRYTQQVAQFYKSRTMNLGTDSIELCRLVEEQLDLQARTDGVGRLLQHLNEEQERADEQRLNRLVFVVGFFGVVQAFAALLDISELWPNPTDGLPRVVGQQAWVFSALVYTSLLMLLIVVVGLVVLLGGGLKRGRARRRKVASAR
jgi:hypothetical protein